MVIWPARQRTGWVATTGRTRCWCWQYRRSCPDRLWAGVYAEAPRRRLRRSPCGGQHRPKGSRPRLIACAQNGSKPRRCHRTGRVASSPRTAGAALKATRRTANAGQEVRYGEGRIRQAQRAVPPSAACSGLPERQATQPCGRLLAPSPDTAIQQACAIARIKSTPFAPVGVAALAQRGRAADC